MKCSYIVSLSLALIFVIGFTEVKAQQTEVSGVVTDAQTGEALPGVNIVVKGTSQGTSTGKEGKYSLTAGSNDTLSFSFVGFETKQVPVKGRSEINVSLAPSTMTGEEVVVVGYGTQQRSDLTGSLSSVKSEDFNAGANTSVEGLIQGKVAGARVVETSGEPGGGLSINIRGASSVNAGTGPLYVVDGVPMENTPAQAGTGAGFVGSRSPRSELSSLNPSDIESIEVLKDASATAIYGSRGANGVVLITTKSGREGQVQVNYDGYVGIQNPSNELDMLTPQQYQSVINGIIDDGGGDPEQRVEDNELSDGTTDWRDQVYQPNALVYNNNLSFSGGSQSTQYYVSFNMMNQDGMVKSSAYKKYGGRINLDQKVSDRFNWGVKLNADYIKDDYAPTGYGLNENAGALYTAMFWDPTKPVRNEDGEYFESTDLTMENPVALVNGQDSFRSTYRYFGSAFAEFDILSNLMFKANIGGDVKSQRRDTYISRLTQQGRAFGGIASISEGQATNYLLEGTLNYKNSFGKHEVSGLAGATTQEFLTIRDYQEASGFSTDVTSTNNMTLGDQETYDMNSTKFGYTLISYIGRVNYNYDSKYLFTGTFRADGSSKFGENSKYGYFPSFALGWKVKEEDFMQDLDAVSNLKLRFSWGETGNQEIGNYLSLTTFDAGGTPIWGGSPYVGLSPTRLANEDIKWETTRQWNIGVDFGFIEQRITGSIDYYQKDTFDMLLNLPIPNSTGYTSQINNVGSIKNTGLDISLNTRNISTSDFYWTTNLSFSTLENTVEDLGGIPEIITGNAGFSNGFFLIREGVPLRSFYGYEVAGIWQEDDDFSQTQDNVQPGSMKYVDQNGDGTVNADDRVILGDSFPDYTFSIGNTVSYKNLSLNIFIEGAQGLSMLNNNLVDMYFPVQFRRNKLSELYLNRWTPENPSDKYPSFVNPLSQGQKSVNSRTVQDASYIRLKTVRLSYSLSPATLPSMLRSASVYVTGENLYTITDYTGLDPAVNSNGNSNARIDYNTYPLSRTFTAGIKLGF